VICTVFYFFYDRFRQKEIQHSGRERESFFRDWNGKGFSPSFFVWLGRDGILFCGSVTVEIWKSTPVSPSTSHTCHSSHISPRGSWRLSDATLLWQVWQVKREGIFPQFFCVIGTGWDLILREWDGRDLKIHSRVTLYFTHLPQQSRIGEEAQRFVVILSAHKWTYTDSKDLLLLSVWPKITEYFKSQWEHRCLHLSCCERACPAVSALLFSLRTHFNSAHFCGLTLDWAAM